MAVTVANVAVLLGVMLVAGGGGLDAAAGRGGGGARAAGEVGDEIAAAVDVVGNAGGAERVMAAAVGVELGNAGGAGRADVIEAVCVDVADGTVAGVVDAV